MNVWKEFCRHVESKLSRRHFGDLVSVIERCAIFEFTDEQIDEAQEHEPADLSSEDEEHPIPPFPFPQMCMVGSGGVIVLQSPVMDEETGILQFDMMMFEMTDRGSFFEKALCIVDSTKRDENGQFPMEVQQMHGIWAGGYWDEENPAAIDTHRMIPEDMEAQLRDSKKRATEELEKAKKRGKLRAIQEAQAIYDHVLEDEESSRELIEQARQLHEDVALLEKSSAQTQVKEAREGFYLGLQEVNWINLPDHFTIEVGAEEPPRKNKKSKNPRARRLAERDRHIILKKSDITKRWKKAHQGGTHAPPIPHLRRGHYKTLRSEKFKEMRGKRIWVRATNVGGECVEWRDGNVRYKVL